MNIDRATAAQATMKHRKPKSGPPVRSSELVRCASSEHEPDPNKQDTIVAIKPCCNHVVFAAVNLPRVVDADMRKEIGELVASGCRIEHWPVDAVRKAKWGCKCERT